MTSARHATSATSAPVSQRDVRAGGERRPRARRSGAPRHAGSPSRHRLRNVAVTLVGVLAFTLTLGGTVYAQLQSSVDTIDVGSLVAPQTNAAGEVETTNPPADPNAGTALNVLIIGSDSRDDGAVGDGFDSVLADTHIIAHISADRSRVELVSIPRDTMVDIPECPTSGDTVSARYGMYNSAFAEAYVAGGDTRSAVACDITLAQSVTGLTIDGWVLVEMGGFIDMVDALGGVDICIPEAIDAPKADLQLAQGQQTLNGKEALGYARARSGDGLSGSDPDRIERQQHLMSAMVDEVLSRNVLTDGPALYQMLDAALGSLTVSENLSSLTDMAGLALSLRTLGADDVTFLTTPFAAYAPDPNRLVFIDSEVDAIWAAMAKDEPIPTAASEEESEEGGGSEDGSETASDGAGDGSSEDPSTEEATTPAEGGTEGANADDLNPVCPS